ncbi:DUF3455 domain-containing protein [Trinickia sp. LjRoot230]|uniref:DUF3455 domain-containing protein n=1 Tax=Trinickia sp. LjRoot230 TaxID=3342288 RepID=UPI003ECDB602
MNHKVPEQIAVGHQESILMFRLRAPVSHLDLDSVMKVTALATLVIGITCLAACTTAPPVVSEVPDIVRANSNETLVLTLRAHGDELYECRRAHDGSYSWVARGPEGRLYDEHGQETGVAFPGPGWQLFDGSWVIGETDTEVYENAAALPWTRFTTLRASRHGKLGKVSSIQSIDTQGGHAPTAECEAESAGSERLVPYSAQLRFFTTISAPVRNRSSSQPQAMPLPEEFDHERLQNLKPPHSRDASHERIRQEQEAGVSADRAERAGIAQGVEESDGDASAVLR